MRFTIISGLVAVLLVAVRGMDPADAVRGMDPVDSNPNTLNDGVNGKKEKLVAYAQLLASVIDPDEKPASGSNEILIRLIRKTCLEGLDDYNTYGDVVLCITTPVADRNALMQIEEGLPERFGDKFNDDNHFGTTMAMVKQLEALMKLMKPTADDILLHVLPMKTQFLPQAFAYKSLAFTSKWISNIPAYLVYMTAAYLDRIQDGSMDPCSLSKQLKIIREDTITAAKALARSRYEQLKGTNKFTKWPAGCKGAMCMYAKWFSYEDPIRGNTYSKPISKVQSYILGDVGSNSMDIVYDQMVSKVNKFFDQSVCACSQHCPSPIQRHEINFNYPASCYGTRGTSDAPGSGTCSLPCHKYGSTYNWCLTGQIHQSDLIFENLWDYCTPHQNFAKCMPLK